MAEKRKKSDKEYGEGNYAATRNFNRAQQNFVKSHRAEIPAKGMEARRALEGKEGKELRSAAARAKARSRAKASNR